MSKSMTMTQKILAYHAKKDYVEPGDLIFANVDLVLGNDVTTPVAIKEFEKIGVDTALTFSSFINFISSSQTSFCH